MKADLDLAGALRDPSNKAAWNALLTENMPWMTAYLRRGASQYSLHDWEVDDIFQVALIRIVVESSNILDVSSYRGYWRAILRTSLYDFVRAKFGSKEEPVGEPIAHGPSAEASLELKQLEKYLSARTALVREVLRGLALGETAQETADRLGTTEGTVFVVRSTVRRDLRDR